MDPEVKAALIFRAETRVAALIVGRLIPAGTGAYLRSLQKIANERDAELTSALEEAIEPLPADLQLELESSES